MAEWKKVIVSGSSANLANVQVDSLSSGVVTGADGNLTTTAVNGTGNIVATTNATGLVHSGSFSGSFEGDGSNLTGITATQLSNSLTDGNGINNFTFDGSSAISISVQTSGSSLTTDASGVGIAAEGVKRSHIGADAIDGTKVSDGVIDTEHIAADAITADEIDDGAVGTAAISTAIAGDGLNGGGGTALSVDVSDFAGTGLEDDGAENLRLATQGNGIAGGNGTTLSVNVSGSSLTVNSDGVGIAAGGVRTSHIENDAVTGDKLNDTGVTANSYGSTTAVPVLTVDAQGRITAASTAAIATSFDIAGQAGSSDTVAGGETLIFSGSAGTGITTEISDNVVTIKSDGLVSGSSIASSNQGEVALTTNGVAASAVDLGLKTDDDVTFNTATLSAGATVTAGGLTVTAGGATITAGGLGVNGGAVTLGTTGTTVEGGGLTVTAGGATVTAGGLTVSAGGADVTGNSTVGGDLTVTGDLLVSGDTVSLNTTNMNIEDQFILLDSGSAGNTDNGIVFASGSANAGDSLFYDAGKERLSFAKSVAWNATAVTPDAFIPYVVDTQESHDDTDVKLAKRGNIKVDANDVYIYI